jgi:hypothetical protein
MSDSSCTAGAVHTWHFRLGDICKPVVCTENLVRVDDVMESPKLAE